MRRQLILLTTLLALAPGAVEGHALFPGQQVVVTAGERAIAQFQTANDRRNVAEYRVELFDYESWTPTRFAVASQDRIIMPSVQAAQAQASAGLRRFTVMVDLDGKPERTIRVCTKSVPAGPLLGQASTSVNTRVCSKLVVRRMQ